MPPVPGEHPGLGTASLAVGVTSLLLGAVVPILLAGGFVGMWLAWRGRQRVIDGEAANPRVVGFGFATSGLAAAAWVALLLVGIYGAVVPTGD